MIERQTILRLVNNLFANADQGTYEMWVRDGFVLCAQLDLQDLATIARIISGETIASSDMLDLFGTDRVVTAESDS